VTSDEIIEICAGSAAEAWVYWLYVPRARSGAIAISPAAADRGRAGAYYARALYLGDVAIGIAWAASQGERFCRPEWACAFSDPLCEHHWVDLLHDGIVVARYAAVQVDGGRASLPAPRVDWEGEVGRSRLWVPRHKYAIVRLANEIDPECNGFDDCFQRAGIEVR
jgi:hypothetical protein